MMLVEQGKVDLQAPVETYLPEFKGQMVEAEKDEQHVLLHPLEDPVLVADVLRHTSGLPFLSRLEPRIDILTLRETVYAAAMTNLLFQPRSKYLYSNAGSNVGGRIVEVITGMPFEQFLQDRLLTPLNMHDTTFWPTEAQLTRLAKAYKPDEQKTSLVEMPISQLTYPLQNRSRQANPGGGLFSTAADMGQFCRMILNGGNYEGNTYLSPASIRKMTSIQTGSLTCDGFQPGGGYGLGWNTQKADPGNTDQPLVGRSGHGGALSTQFWLHPQSGLGTIYLVQHQGYACEDGDNIYRSFETAALC
jgi:CubicO group peptidase (beta-lactamase class C family)